MYMHMCISRAECTCTCIFLCFLANFNKLKVSKECATIYKHSTSTKLKNTVYIKTKNTPSLKPPSPPSPHHPLTRAKFWNLYFRSNPTPFQNGSKTSLKGGGWGGVCYDMACTPRPLKNTAQHRTHSTPHNSHTPTAHKHTTHHNTKFYVIRTIRLMVAMWCTVISRKSLNQKIP